MNPADTRQELSPCEHRKTNLTLADRMYACSCCGVILDRDYNDSLIIGRVEQHCMASAKVWPRTSRLEPWGAVTQLLIWWGALRVEIEISEERREDVLLELVRSDTITGHHSLTRCRLIS
jgi:hypothetical protein